jgi:type VI secretion system secreted protein VgrG
VWAGKNWGAIHIPRIGHEVIIEFLDGDPDRPIITGRVYNEDNPTPYTLPANMTQSGIKSRSSKGGGDSNFNEIRFEDLKGSEHVYLQAEKDHIILVKNDELHTVGHDRTKHVVNDEKTNVDGNRTEEVGKNETITIHGNRTETVDCNEDITITGGRNEKVLKSEDIKITGNRSKTVGQNETNDIGGSRTTSVGGSDGFTITGARDVNIKKSDTLNVKEDRTLIVKGNDSLKVTKKILIDGGEEIMLKSGSASILLQKDGTILIKGKNVTIEGSAKINVTAKSDLILKGSKISGN